jgi:F0F1-type ATP synthase membrane subunit b/b'
MDERVSQELEKYLRVIGTYENEFAKWQARVKKLVKRYRDDTRGSGGNETAKFNILWSNVQTLIPAVYAKLPKADVSRRFGDNDPVGRVAAQLVERAIDFEIEHYPDFRSTMKYDVEDRFLGGRGTAWVRYEPHVAPIGVEDDGVSITSAIEQGEGAPPPLEEIEYERAPVDYVHWKDFGHSQGRTWEEVGQVWRWVYMTREALVERFGEEMARQIPTDQGPETLNAYRDSKRQYNLAKICELWDKETLKVYWLSKGMSHFIDVRDDPLNFEGFFPCPKPLYATTTSDNLVPVPDFVLYQDQAMELDILSDRIDGLVKALRVRGVYDASQPALQRLMTEGDNNSLIPVDKWAAFSEKGGLKGSVDLLPLDTIAQALIQCYQARADIKGQIYEITGISDIIRGQSAASETATAQQIKGQYAGLRLRSMQEDVALFATEVIRLKAQVMCMRYQPQTILAYSAAEQMSDADKALIPQALQLIRDKPLRNFRIDIAADSLVQIDEAQEKQDRLQFLQAFGGFLQQALPVGQASPELVPVMMDLLKYGVQAFKAARPLEGTIDAATEQLKQMAAQPRENPAAQQAQMEAQAEQAKAQADMQMESQKVQMQGQLEQAKLQMQMQIEQMKAQTQMQIEQQRQSIEAQIEKYKADLDARTRLQIAQIEAVSETNLGVGNGPAN